MNAFPELRSVAFTDISNRTIYQVKRDSMTTLSTGLTTHFRSPSPKKPCFLRSPAPVFSAITDEFTDNSLFSEPDRRKRDREVGGLSSNKKIKTNHGPVTKLVTELFDPEAQTTLCFRCFREVEVVRDKDIEKKIIKNECDDDCPTDDLQVDACVEYMSKEIELALYNYNI